MTDCCATMAGALGRGGGRIDGKGGGFLVGSGGGGCERGGSGGDDCTSGETPGASGGAVSAGVSGNKTLGEIPSKPGSRARIRSISGGCVANPKSRLFKPFAKKKWLASSARSDWSWEPPAMPPIFFS